MIIKFNWNTGWMELNTDYVLESMPMTKYRKWAKLFAQYGETEQHTEFLQMVTDYTKQQEQEKQRIEKEVAECQAKADAKLPTVMTPNYWQKQVKIQQGHLNGADKRLKRYKTIYSVLKELVT